MSSNLKIQKECEFCGNVFTARTLYTRYCSKSCNNKHYKQLLADKNLTNTTSKKFIEVLPTEIFPNTKQDYYEIKEAAHIMRVSLRTLYRLIAIKKLKKKKILSRTVILKKDIKSFFSNQ
jgi:hypothetical protein